MSLNQNTGGSSGIGLANVNFLLEHGAHVVNGDLNPGSLTHENLTYHRTDVTSWPDLISLFKQAKATHSGKINHVFANAGITSHANYLSEALDEAGDLLEPTSKTLDINLKACINTCTLAIHHLRQQAEGGSVVMTSSASAYQPLCVADYTASKHGVLGFMRGMNSTLAAAGNTTPKIRINAIAPSWTISGILDTHELFAEVGGLVQPASAVAPSVALLMADGERNGQLIFSEESRYWEVEEGILKPAYLKVRTPGAQALDETLGLVMRLAEERGVDVTAQ
jgi:NAD(P)-dependent dehydrogenase (short-subunit alcohol dehydrogenase family)